AGFSESLRTEVMADKIDVTTIFPGAIETEIFETSANQTGLEMPAFVPKFPARELARIIVQNARFPQPEVVMAMDAMAINFFNTVAPGFMDYAMGLGLPFVEAMRQGTKQAKTGSGNLYQSKNKQ